MQIEEELAQISNKKLGKAVFIREIIFAIFTWQRDVFYKH